MLVLAIETSCDETAVAIVQDGREVLSSHVASQIAMHQQFGGVVPEVAAREHLKVIDNLCDLALRDAAVSFEQIDAIAVTRGPGLIGALLVGISYAKALAVALNKPLIPVDHVHAHVHGALLGVQDLAIDQTFPCLALVVSGGHTNLYYMATPTSFELLGYSLDDACGECFDKVAKLLGLPYPGGPRIEKLAASGNASAFAMPRVIEQKQRLVFSYSGLKTHMASTIQKGPKPWEGERLADLCAGFQDVALGQIVRKLQGAVTMKPDVACVLVAGGVAANQRFRKLVSESIRQKAIFPALDYCSDNAAMIAALGYHQLIAAQKNGTALDLHDTAWDAYSQYQHEADH